MSHDSPHVGRQITEMFFFDYVLKWYSTQTSLIKSSNRFVCVGFKGVVALESFKSVFTGRISLFCYLFVQQEKVIRNTKADCEPKKMKCNQSKYKRHKKSKQANLTAKVSNKKEIK